MKPKKVAYMIWTFHVGVGGHYQSLISTIKALDKKKIKSLIINCGAIPAVTLEKSGLDFSFVRVTPFSIKSASKQVKKLTEVHDIDIIHCFDYFSYHFSKKTSKPTLLTIPGGKNNPSLPQIKNILLFSSENYSFYKNKPAFSKSNLFLLRNRVGKLIQDKERIKKLESAYKPKGIKILKIARIGSYYKNSILDSIKFSNFLSSKGISNTLFIIGYVEDDKVKNEINARILNAANSKNINLITDDFYTNNANQLLDLADIVMGTGRGIMEALSLNKISYAPIRSGKAHVLVNRETIDELQYYNFSERARLKSEPKEKYCYKHLLNTIENKNEYKLWAENVFNERYSVNNITQKLIHIYDEVLESNYKVNYSFKLVARIFRYLTVDLIKRNLLNV